MRKLGHKEFKQLTQGGARIQSLPISSKSPFTLKTKTKGYKCIEKRSQEYIFNVNNGLSQCGRVTDYFYLLCK